LEDNRYIGNGFNQKKDKEMALDSEQKRVLKAIVPSMLAFTIGYPIFMRIFGKLDSWKEALLWMGVGILIVAVLGVFYILGSKIPKKDD
jgi:hypothetical protein